MWSLSMLGWLNCYTVCVASDDKEAARIHCRSHRLPITQLFMIESYMEYKNKCYIGYGYCFCHQAASQPSQPLVYCGLYNMESGLAGEAMTSRCKYCFSLDHQSTDCDLTLEHTTKPYQSYH